MPSSVIASIRYDPATEILRVIFLSGSIYDYKNVPQTVYNAMRRAISKGSFLNTKIKGHYAYEKKK